MLHCVFAIPIMFTTPIILHVCLHYSLHDTYMSSLFLSCHMYDGNYYFGLCLIDIFFIACHSSHQVCRYICCMLASKAVCVISALMWLLPSSTHVAVIVLCSGESWWPVLRPALAKLWRLFFHCCTTFENLALVVFVLSFFLQPKSLQSKSVFSYSCLWLH